MRIIHTADWHLGNIFYRHRREDEFRHYLDWLLQALLEHDADALLVSGDVFDNANPSAQAEELYFGFLRQVVERIPGLQVVIIAGNHDSAARLEAAAAFLGMHHIYIRGMVPLDEKNRPSYPDMMIPLGRKDSAEASCVCMAIPFLHSSDFGEEHRTMEEAMRDYMKNLIQYYKKSDYHTLPCIGMAHFYAGGAQICEGEHSERLSVGGQDLVNIEKLDRQWKYFALGHIHRSQRVGGSDVPVYYSGSALPMSFAEKHYQHGAKLIEVDADDKECTVSDLYYEPLRRLLSIPERGSLVSSEVLPALDALPDRKEKSVDTDWPYLEINLREDRPIPELLSEVTEVLSHKCVRFCRMTAVRGTKSEDDGNNMSLERLRQFSPLEMAEHIYKNRYQEPLPEELRTRFLEAVEALNDTEEA